MDDQCLNPAKVFVGGLGQGTTTYSLRNFFQQYGNVTDAAVMTDKVTGRSRGFGFCTFEDEAAAERCLNARHKIDGVSCEVRRAIPRDGAREAAPYDTIEDPGKLFVGGLPDEVTEEKLKGYFEQFGGIKQTTLMYDKNNHRSRGFGFIIFEIPSDCHKAIGEHPQLGRVCEAKKAEPRQDARTPGSRGGAFSQREGGDRFGGGGGERWGEDRRKGYGGRGGFGGRYGEMRGGGGGGGAAAPYGRGGYGYDSYAYSDAYGYGYADPSMFGNYGAGYQQMPYGSYGPHLAAGGSAMYQGYGDGYGQQAYGQVAGYEAAGATPQMASAGFGPQRGAGRYGQAIARASPY